MVLLTCGTNLASDIELDTYGAVAEEECSCKWEEDRLCVATALASDDSVRRQASASLLAIICVQFYATKENIRVRVGLISALESNF
mgnify:CR=1 FL=1